MIVFATILTAILMFICATFGTMVGHADMQIISR